MNQQQFQKLLSWKKKIRKLLYYFLLKYLLTWINSEATLDGGDVLFVPDRDFYETYPCSTIWCGDLFVGISARTNERGAEVLRKAFAPLNINVHNVSLSASNSDKFDTLHLKSLTTALAPSTLVIGTNEYDYFIQFN